MKTIYTAIIIVIIMLIINNISAYADTLHIRVSPVNIDFYLEDMSGRITGYTDKQLLQQIPYADQFGRSGESDVDNPTAYQSWDEIYTSDSNAFIPLGKYKLVVSGNNINNPTQIIARIEIFKNNQIMRVSQGDYIFPGQINIYEFDIPANPVNNQIILSRVSASGSLIADINALAKAEYIGNAKFVSELIKEINEIESKKAKGKVDDGLTPAQKAKKEYQELLSELIEKNKKPEKDEYIQSLAIWILQKDIEYIINHL